MGTIWNNPDGLDVHFGTRIAGERANFGVTSMPGGLVEYVAVVRGSDFTSGSATYNGILWTFPAGFVVRSVVAEVTEVFNIGGTSALMYVGVSGSVATNFAAGMTEAQLEAVGSFIPTTGGTLAANAVLAAASTITIGMGGTSPTVTGRGGQVKIVILGSDPLAA